MRPDWPQYRSPATPETDLLFMLALFRFLSLHFPCTLPCMCRQDGALGEVWGPTQDGGYLLEYSFLPEMPVDLRRQQTFAKIPIIIGINQQDGVQKAGWSDSFDSFSKFIRDGMPSHSSSYKISGPVPVCWLLFQCFVLKPAKFPKS